jgi:hypothetical protein
MKFGKEGKAGRVYIEREIASTPEAECCLVRLGMRLSCHERSGCRSLSSVKA